MSNATAAPSFGQIERPTRADCKSKLILAAGALAALTVLTYLPSFKCGFIWDDDAYIINNPTLRSAFGLQLIWTSPQTLPQYYPLVHTTFWLEYHAWGLSPAGYHVDNVLLHAANAVLLWIALRRLRVPGAWLAAAIFAVHPVQVESVTWVTERKNVLSTFFYLLSLLCYLRWTPIGEESKNPASALAYALSLAFFVLALLSKTVACSLPAAILIIIWWKQSRLKWRDLPPLIPFFLLGLAAAGFTSWIETHHVDARGIDFSLNKLQRCQIAAAALFFYAGKVLAPFHLIFMYPRWNLKSLAVFGYESIAALILVAAVLWHLRKTLGRGPLAAAMLFAGTLVPALGFFNVAPMRFSFVADHFQYLACAALIALVVAALSRALQTVKLPLWIIGAPILALLALLSWSRQSAYVNATTLWQDTLRQNPDCWMAHDNLGHIALLAGQTDNALQQYQTALQLAPGEAETHMAIAGGLYAQGKIDDAMNMYAQSLTVDPTYAAAHFARGLIFEKRGQLDDARTEYQAVLNLRDDYAPAHFHLGVLARSSGDIQLARGEFAKAAADDPFYADAFYSLGNIELNAQHPADAAAQYRLALRADPQYAAAHQNLGVALMRMNLPDEANRQFRAARGQAGDNSH
jgi:tetratricopeptide (TPR) repeat protein